MSKAFPLKILSPTAQLADTFVNMVEVPGAEGDMGILPDHAPFVAMLRPGVVQVHMADGSHRAFFAATGYVDVSAEGCTILSDHIQDVNDISRIGAEEALAAAEASLAAATTNAEVLAAEELIVTAKRLLDAARG